jgi:hypothetical protein
MKQTLLALAVVGLAACRAGMTVEQFEPASSPNGATARLTTADGELTGELIEMQASGLLILTGVGRPGSEPSQGYTLRLVPFSAVRASSFPQLGRVSIRDGQAPTGAVRERLRLVSRFPHGLSPALLKQLLARYGQTEVAGVRP